MSFLEQVGFDALKAQAQTYLRGLTNEVKKAITELGDKIVAALEDAVSRIVTASSTEFEQLKTALGNLQTAVDNLAASDAEKAALQAALDEATTAAGNATDALNTAAEQLESDDPTA